MLIIITSGSCLFGGDIHNPDSLMGVIRMLVFHLCWDDDDDDDDVHLLV